MGGHNTEFYLLLALRTYFTKTKSEDRMIIPSKNLKGIIVIEPMKNLNLFHLATSVLLNEGNLALTESSHFINGCSCFHALVNKKAPIKPLRMIPITKRLTIYFKQSLERA
jgi:hypothetical protein